MTQQVDLFKHQSQLILFPDARPECEYFFLIGGYGCGKTSGDVYLLMNLIQKYYKTPIVIGVGGVTITLLRKTLIGDFERTLIAMGIKYTDDKNSNVIRIGAVEIVLIAIEQPNLIYAYNFSIFLCDELDELPQDKAMQAFMAIQERTRKVLPDGRVPYSVFTTTAQGYSGTYAIVEQLKEIGQQFVIIRGRTKDNTSLSPTYVRRLYALYNENERLAYLEGFFVNLNTGRVYGDYDADKHMINDSDIKIADDAVVQVGQDLNAGFSKGVAITKIDKTIYIHKTFNFAQIGHAPKIIRNAFPMNDVYWYPDASGKEVLTGYLEETKSENINVRMGTVNPAVVERIFFVNKLFKTGRLKICRSCKDLDIALKTRQYDDLGKPEKGKGETSPDHICDALEYVLWRVVSSDPDFRDLWELSKTARDENRDVAKDAT